MNGSPTLGQLLRSFFEDYLPCQKGLQPTTIGSYRDAHWCSDSEVTDQETRG